MSNLVYLNNRYHDPTLGGFISVDPLITLTGEAYIYGAASPVRYSDPTGLAPDTSAWIRRLADAGNPGADGVPTQAFGCTYSSGLECFQTRHGYGPGDTGYAYAKQPWTEPEPLREEPPGMPPLDDAPGLWDEIINGFDEGSPGGGISVCGEFDAGGGGLAAAGSQCLMLDTDGVATLMTVGGGPAIGTLVPAASGSVGVEIANGDAEELAGWAMCGNASGGSVVGGAGALCGGILFEDGVWDYTGAWTFYAGVSVTSPSVSTGYSYTYTWVNRVVKWPWKYL